MSHQSSSIDPRELRFAILAVDTVVMTFHEGKLWVRLIPVHLPPHFEHMHGLPGGLIRPDETARDAAQRLIRDKAGIYHSDLYLEQLHTFSEVDRDPRGRVVAVAYVSVVSWDSLSAEEKKNTDTAAWVVVDRLPKLAYDHADILSAARRFLATQAGVSTIISQCISREFTLTELEEAYECVLGRTLDKRNFRKKILKLDIVKELAKERRGQRSRPAQLYAFRSKKVVSIDLF